LRKVKPTVDSGKPKDYNHLKQKAKKTQMEHERWQTIDRHNQELLGRMEQIMHSRGRVDHINNYQSKPCLHHFVRQQEAERVHRENLGLLRRLQTVKPMYRTDVWESDFKAHQDRKNNLSLFPAVKGATSWKVNAVWERRPCSYSTHLSISATCPLQALLYSRHLPISATYL
jgi:hypothetical protein